MDAPQNDPIDSIPPRLRSVRAAAREALGEVVHAGPLQSDVESVGLMLSSRTRGGRDLPPYYLVYFLLVDLLDFENLGQWEKVAWIVPVRLKGRLYSIEHSKMGLGIFAPTLDVKATSNAPPSEAAEADAREIAALIRRATTTAKPYFEWRAEQVAGGIHLNVVNNSDWLSVRYEFFRNRFQELTTEAERRKDERIVRKETLEDGTVVTSGNFSSYELRNEADLYAQAAIDAFFSWTEHVFIHLSILQNRLHTGEEVAQMAGSDWKTKFKNALDINNTEMKKHYDTLLDLRDQIRNFMAHGAFGKRGEAFSFHSGAGAVPIILTQREKHRYSLNRQPEFVEASSITEIERFIKYLWSEPRKAMRAYIFSGLPSILTFVADGTYAQVIQSEEEMKKFVDDLTRQSDIAANMDW